MPCYNNSGPISSNKRTEIHHLFLKKKREAFGTYMHIATTHDKWRVSQGELRQGNFSKLHCGLKFYIPLAFVAIKSFLANGWRWRDWGCLGEKDKVKDREVNWCMQTLGMSITSASMIAQILLSKHVEGRLEEIRSPILAAPSHIQWVSVSLLVCCSLAYTVDVCPAACMSVFCMGLLPLAVYMNRTVYFLVISCPWAAYILDNVLLLLLFHHRHQVIVSEYKRYVIMSLQHCMFSYLYSEIPDRCRTLENIEIA